MEDGGTGVVERSCAVARGKDVRNYGVFILHLLRSARIDVARELRFS
jgi:hypothetical protein